MMKNIEKYLVFILFVPLVFGIPKLALSEEDRTSDQATDGANARLKTLEGSSSRFSGQFNLTYYGAALSDAFSANRPNPGHVSPPPLVYLTGSLAVRYRLDESTTTGFGTGLTTQTPFQGPKNTTLADPYLDIAHSHKIGPISSRSYFAVNAWTNQEYHDQFGYLVGFLLSNDSYFAFPFGLTVGLYNEVDSNIFSSAPGFDPLEQIVLQWIANPYVEFRLSKRFNLRASTGTSPILLTQSGTLKIPTFTQALGVTVAVTDWLFVYPYIIFYPLSGHVSIDSTTWAFNIIVNLF